MNSDDERIPLILSIDDDHDLLALIENHLSDSGYEVMTAEHGAAGLDAVKDRNPDLILLDVVMPEMDGYEVCSLLQLNDQTSNIPVIFVTAREDEQDRARAFSVGAVDYLVKPIRKGVLLEKVKQHLETGARWGKMEECPPTRMQAVSSTYEYAGFPEFLLARLNLNPEESYKVSRMTPSEIYVKTASAGIGEKTVAKCIAEFLNLPYVPHVGPEDIQLGVLSAPFCRSHHVVPVRDAIGGTAFILSNPFDWELLNVLAEFADMGEMPPLMISEPDSVEMLATCATPKEVDKATEALNLSMGIDSQEGSDTEKSAVVSMVDSTLNKAVVERASDIHIEPKEERFTIRFRIDGELKEFSYMEKQMGVRVISRLKLLGGLDAAESRRPQEGAYAAVIGGKDFNLRMSTSGMPNGESIIIRLLEPYSKPRGLKLLGMSDQQSDLMEGLVACNAGGILTVGPTGSGKTTTIYNLLHMIDHGLRTLISVEDPVEYRIPFANQQQVNERAGITFDALLEAAVRQDPDVLFIGEIRDQHSGKIAMDFASTGHLTITSLHTSNTTTAIARLERLGISREVISESLIAIIAQRLVKKLCRHCKEVVPVSEDERKILEPFINEVPSQVAHAMGCPECHSTGYFGVEGVYEILELDGEISEMIRSGVAVSEIRRSIRNRGDCLISNHAAEKVKDLVCAPRDAYEKVMVEDIKLKGLKTLREPSEAKSTVPVPPFDYLEKETVFKGDDGSVQYSPDDEDDAGVSILVVDDDEDTRRLLVHILEEQGYAASVAADGIDALLCMDKTPYNLVIADVNMPNLDGFKLVEIMIQKGIDTPVLFLTSRVSAEDEETGLSLGAIDYIKKPIQKEVMLLRIKSIFKRMGITSRASSRVS